MGPTWGRRAIAVVFLLGAAPVGAESAGGRFYPQAWGWMVHVYPFAGDELSVAFAMDAP